MAADAPPLAPEQIASLRRRFTAAALPTADPSGTQREAITLLDDQLCLLAQAFVMLSPVGREQSVALTKLEEFGFWMRAAIARPPVLPMISAVPVSDR